VNLKYGVADRRSRTGSESATCTACAGTMIMEFGALSRLTGDPKFEVRIKVLLKSTVLLCMCFVSHAVPPCFP
jgi:hypothetical protein